MRQISFAFVIALSMTTRVFAISYGNPADMPPRGSIEVSSEYSKQFLYVSNNVYNTLFKSQRLIIRGGYVFYSWLQIYGIVGGADANLDWRLVRGGTPLISNGSWELTPGIGARFKPPLEFLAIGLEFHTLFDARYLYIRSRQQEFTSGIWRFKGMTTINEFQAAGLIAAFMKRYNLSFYGGIAARYEWSEFHYTAILDRTINGITIHREVPGQSLLGDSMGEPAIPHLLFPFLGINWHMGGDYVFCFEANLADVSEFGSLNPKFGFTIGMSNYR